MKKFFTLFTLMILLYTMISSIISMPVMGNAQNPSNSSVSQHYLGKSIKETAAPNVIAAIITDYRAIDTLGEATILFTAIAAALSVLTGSSKAHDSHHEDIQHDLENHE